MGPWVDLNLRWLRSMISYICTYNLYYYPEQANVYSRYQGPNMSRNDRKNTYEHVHPVKIQISLWICAVWSESSLGTFE